MKNSNIASTKSKYQEHHNKPKPDIRDNLDNRKNEEYDIKGDDITHNKKEMKSKKKNHH